MTQNHIIANLSGPEGVRHTIHEGKDTLVVPVVMIVEGVLNGALLTQSEFGKYVESWNGVPVPVLHPEERGQPISANRPDVIERTIGRIYHARVDNGKLKAEAWIDVDKTKRLGFCELLEKLESGQMVEVSTGYFSDDRPMQGEYNGKEYMTQHVNIRPDHLALLPGQIGACSVADGCGTRVNSKKESKVDMFTAVMDFLSKATGLRENDLQANGLQRNCKCQEQGETMTDKLKEQAEKLKANKKITPEQFDMLMSMDPEQQGMVQALLAALGGAGGAEMPETEAEDETVEGMEGGYDEEGLPMNTNKDKVTSEKPKAMSADQIETIVANRVRETIRRDKVTEKLTANERCPFSEDDLKAMSVDHLEKLEKSLRPADYSMQGGPVTHGATNVEPMIPRGFINNKREQKEA